jgi:hypothetical protein
MLALAVPESVHDPFQFLFPENAVHFILIAYMRLFQNFSFGTATLKSVVSQG